MSNSARQRKAFSPDGTAFTIFYPESWNASDPPPIPKRKKRYVDGQLRPDGALCVGYYWVVRLTSSPSGCSYAGIGSDLCAPRWRAGRWSSKELAQQAANLHPWSPTHVVRVTVWSKPKVG